MKDNKDKEETLITHLEALRQTLMKCFISLGVVLPFSFYFAPNVLNIFIKFSIGENKVTLNYFSPVEVFLVQIKIAALMTLVICFPYIAKKIWDFILPALYDNERKAIKSIVFISSGLFFAGVAFCIFIILPWIIKFGLSFATSTVTPVFGIANIVNTALWLALSFGIMFQMPVITYYLIKSGIIDYETVSSKRPYVVVILLTVAAILTPPDIISQIMLFVPAYALFEAGLLFSRRLG